MIYKYMLIIEIKLSMRQKGQDINTHQNYLNSFKDSSKS